MTHIHWAPKCGLYYFVFDPHNKRCTQEDCPLTELVRHSIQSDPHYKVRKLIPTRISRVLDAPEGVEEGLETLLLQTLLEVLVELL